MLFAAASTATEPSRGWGGPIAIVAAFVAFRILMPVMRRLRDKIGNPSPPPALPAGSRPKVQATVRVNEREPRVQQYAWGAIGYGETDAVEPYEEPERPGWRHRLAQARQVMATGSHELPPDDDELPDEEEPDIDPEIDLDLDDAGLEKVEEDPEARIKEYISRALDLGIPYNQIVRVLMDHYGISKSTAKRRIGEVRAERS